MIYGGDGLARLPADDRGTGKAVFIPFVLAGEEVEATVYEEKPGFARARAEAIVASSGHRVAPQCPYFRQCGGCQYQHADYAHQLEIKTAILRENLRRIAKIELQSELSVHASPPWNYRNRARFKVQHAPEFSLGYYRLNSHDLLPVEQCPISSPLINRAIAKLWDAGKAANLPVTIDEVELFANADDSQLMIEAFGPNEDSDFQQAGEQLEKLVPEVTGVTFFATLDNKGRVATSDQAEPIHSIGSANLEYKTQLAGYRVSSGSFFQVNRYLIDKLVEIVTSGQSGTTALDLYAGVGLFSLVLNREFERVIAVESSPTSHADLLYNAPANVKAVRATVEQYLRNRGGKLRPNLVVADPPRGGLGESVVRGLCALDAPRIAYVSCDPATLARDLGGFVTAGYRIEQAHLIDLFPQTFHVESVFHLAR